MTLIIEVTLRSQSRVTPASCSLTSGTAVSSLQTTQDQNGGSRCWEEPFPLSGFSASPGLHVLLWHTPGTLLGTFLQSIKAEREHSVSDGAERGTSEQ